MDQSKVSTDHEYLLMYHKGQFLPFAGYKKDYKGYSNPDNDPRGPWVAGDLTVGMNADMRPNQYYDLVDPKTGKVYMVHSDGTCEVVGEARKGRYSERNP